MHASARDDIAALRRALQQARLTPVVTRRYAMADAVQALLASRGGHVRGKLVVDVLPVARRSSLQSMNACANRCATPRKRSTGSLA